MLFNFQGIKLKPNFDELERVNLIGNWESHNIDDVDFLASSRIGSIDDMGEEEINHWQQQQQQEHKDKIGLDNFSKKNKLQNDVHIKR